MSATRVALTAIPSANEELCRRYLEFPALVKGGSVQPHWLEDGSNFWYTAGDGDSTVIYKVDPRANVKTPLFDVKRFRCLSHVG